MTNTDKKINGCPECGFEIGKVLFGGSAPYLCPSCAANVTSHVTVINLSLKQNTSVVPEFIQYMNRPYGFSFKYPSGWYEGFSNGNLVIQPRNAESMIVGAKEFFGPEITMRAGDQEAQEGFETPPQFFTHYLARQGKNYEGYKLLWKHVQQLSSGQEALEWSFNFKKWSNDFTTDMIIAANRNKLFLLNGTCLSSQMKRLEPIFLKVIQSLSLEV